MRNLIDKILRHPYWTAIGVIAAVVIPITLYFISSDRSSKPPDSDLSRSTSLLFNIEKNGWLHLQEDGRVYEFTLSNPRNGLAIVESIAVEVLDVIEDHYPQLEGMIPEFKYRLVLDPKFRGRRVFSKGFKYAPGEVDRFSVLIESSRKGYDYFFRFVVAWYDAIVKEKTETYSDILVARYPSQGIPYERGNEEVRKKFVEHNERVWTIRRRIRSELKSKQN